MGPVTKADWQLPPGVSRATWDYVSNERIATDYDSFHADHGLLRYDQQIVNEMIESPEFTAPKTILDLGCGTGRSLEQAYLRGHHTIGVDLSPAMLKCAVDKMSKLSASCADTSQHAWLHANMVELDFLQDSTIDLALCLYSSLGMVRGHKNRLRCLRHLQRVLKQSGRFVVHVHNRGNWWTTAEGRRNLLRDCKSRVLQSATHEAGDRYYAYRNLPKMFLHIFSYKELRRDLKQAGFERQQWIWLNQSSTGQLEKAWWLGRIRASGFIVIAHKSP